MSFMEKMRRSKRQPNVTAYGAAFISYGATISVCKNGYE